MNLKEIDVYYYNNQQILVMYIAGLRLKYYVLKDLWYYQIIDDDNTVYLPKINSLSDEEKFQSAIYWEYKINFSLLEKIQNIINDRYILLLAMKTVEINSSIVRDTITINEN